VFYSVWKKNSLEVKAGDCLRLMSCRQSPWY